MGKVRCAEIFRSVLTLFIVSNCGRLVLSQRAPVIQVIEIIPSLDNFTTAETVRELDKVQNSEIIVGQDITANSRLVLRCKASYPVQFVYIGSGRPELSTYTNENEGSQGVQQYEAEVSLGLIGFHQVLREEDSGNYTCMSIQDPKVLSYYYIYVPGPSIFLPPDGYDTEIYFASKDKDVKIPCAVAHPNATVQLYRTSNGKLTCPALDGKRAGYDPKKGFTLNLKDMKSPEGTYVCVASYMDTFRMIEYQLIISKYPIGNPCRNSPCGNKADCDVIDGYPVCYCFRGLSGNPYNGCEASDKKRCYTTSDCATGLFCTQGQCTKDPCSPSPCGKGSTCQAVLGRAKCACKEGYSGKVPYCKKKCISDVECSKNEVCVGNVCQSACSGCGKNAECDVVFDGRRRQTKCNCPAGYSGNAKVECFPSKCLRDADCPFNSYCSRGICIPITSRPPTCPVECGINAECVISKRTRSAECQCRPDFVGDPLTECTQKCPSNHRCGSGSFCRVVKTFGRSDPTEYECLCPPGTSNIPVGSRVTCINETSVPDPGDCFSNNPCPPSASCRISAKYGTPRCTCPAGSLGDAYTQCFVEKCPTGACGKGAMCSISIGRDGQELSYECSCPPGHIGNPNEQCFPDPLSGVCRQNTCRPGQACNINFRTGEQECSTCPPETPRALSDGVCYGSCSPSFPCGVGAECRSKLESGRRVPECYCPPGFTGNPDVMCTRIIDPPPEDLCFTKNPCPPGTTCITRRGVIECDCPKGFTGEYPRCRPEEKKCREDQDCEFGDECIGGLCLSHCATTCGRFGTCEIRGRSTECICFEGYRLDRDGVCTEESLINLCPPNACGENANCFRVFNGSTICSCPQGYTGDAYTRCYPSRFPTSPPVQSPYPLPPPFPFIPENEGYRPPPPDSSIISAPDRFFRSEDECDPRYGRVGGITYQCERGLQCRRGRDGIARCLPPRPPRPRTCQTNRNCRQPEVCRNSTCFNPCHPNNSPCATVPSSECRVVEGRALCACQRGYVGSPLSGLGCRPERSLPISEVGAAEASEPVEITLCDISQVGSPEGCDQHGECQLVNDKPICVCGKEYSGMYPHCQTKCRLDLDCPEGQACMNFQCVNPCEVPNACGSNAQCKVEDHRPECECQEGFVGDARVGCLPKNNIREGKASSNSSPISCTGNRCTFF